MQQYSIKVNLIPDLPTTNFRNGRGLYEGVVCHCTDSGSGDGTGTVWAHKDITTFLGGTTHEDPIAYLANHNITWAQHVQNIKNYYNFISGNTTHPIIGKATVTADVLNIRSGPGTNYSIVATAKKVKYIQYIQKLMISTVLERINIFHLSIALISRYNKRL